MRAKNGERFIGVDHLARLCLTKAFTNRLVKPLAFLAIEPITAAREHLVERNELDHLAFREIRRFVEDEPPVADAGLQGRHGMHRSFPRR